MLKVPRILFASGGTGGHVYPAIAIADSIRGLVPDAVITFAGTKERMEWEAVPKAGYPIHPITVSGFQRQLSLKNLMFPAKLIRGLLQSRQLVKGFDPDIVVGTGGYVSGPVLWAAGMQGRPTVIQEQNAYAGFTNRLLARRAHRIHIAFEEARAFFPAEKCILSGNPVRTDLLSTDRQKSREHFEIPVDARVLLVFGGSLGSPVLNSAMEQSLDRILAGDLTLHVIWQTGARHYDRLKEIVPAHERLRLLKYIDRMDFAYGAADLVVSRAGAITCSELLVTGTPAILVPSPRLAEDHQTKNARAMVANGAAEMLAEKDMASELWAKVDELISNPQRLDLMATAARRSARPGAADRIARDILELAGFEAGESVLTQKGRKETDYS